MSYASANKYGIEIITNAMRDPNISSNPDSFAKTIGSSALSTVEGQEALRRVAENQKNRAATEERQQVYEYGKGLSSLQSGLLGAPKQFTPNDPWYEQYQEKRSSLMPPMVSSEPMQKQVLSLEERLKNIDPGVRRKRVIFDYDSLASAVPGFNTLGQEQVISHLSTLRPEMSTEEIKKVGPVQAHMSKEESYKRSLEEGRNERLDTKIKADSYEKAKQRQHESDILSKEQWLENLLAKRQDIKDEVKLKVETFQENADKYNAQAKDLSAKIDDIMFAGNKDAANKELQILREKALNELSKAGLLLGETSVYIGDKGGDAVDTQPAVNPKTQKTNKPDTATKKPVAAPKKAPAATGDPKLPQGQYYGERRNTNTGVVHKVILDGNGKVLKVLGPK